MAERFPARRGRGASSNRAGRFEGFDREVFDDGWGSLDVEPPPLVTELRAEKTRRIVSTNDSPDIPFNQSINPYKGCEHGCIYCFARPTHAYLGLSPGQDFESRIVYKPEGPEALRRHFARASYVPEVIAIGANTDPYQPAERRLALTRQIIEVLAEHRHPFCIVTKSAGVARDLDLLAPLAADRLVNVLVSITSLDSELARRMEPRAAAPHRRLATVAALAEAGVPVGVLASPMIPGLNDHELDNILEAAAAAGARSAGTILIRLPLEIADLFREWLEEHYPDRAARVLKLIRETRGGELYESSFGIRMRGRGPYAELLARRFQLAAARHGLDRRLPALDTSQFVRPAQRGQLPLF
jgi:DNA repair photolyase